MAGATTQSMSEAARRMVIPPIVENNRLFWGKAIRERRGSLSRTVYSLFRLQNHGLWPCDPKSFGAIRRLRDGAQA
jgi:hypothetical protein